MKIFVNYLLTTMPFALFRENPVHRKRKDSLQRQWEIERYLYIVGKRQSSLLYILPGSIDYRGKGDRQRTLNIYPILVTVT